MRVTNEKKKISVEGTFCTYFSTKNIVNNLLKFISNFEIIWKWTYPNNYTHKYLHGLNTYFYIAYPLVVSCYYMNVELPTYSNNSYKKTFQGERE